MQELPSPAAAGPFASPISLAGSPAPATPQPTSMAAIASAPASIEAATEAELPGEALASEEAMASAVPPPPPAPRRGRLPGITPLLCLLAFVGAVAAAVLLVPAGFSLMMPLQCSSGHAIFPQGKLQFGWLGRCGPQLGACILLLA